MSAACRCTVALCPMFLSDPIRTTLDAIVHTTQLTDRRMLTGFVQAGNLQLDLVHDAKSLTLRRPFVPSHQIVQMRCPGQTHQQNQRKKNTFHLNTFVALYRKHYTPGVLLFTYPEYHFGTR